MLGSKACDARCECTSPPFKHKCGLLTRSHQLENSSLFVVEIPISIQISLSFERMKRIF